MPKLEPMEHSPSRVGARRARGLRVSTSLAEINVVPLVDVMLVLLVIFMVAAPMMQQGFAVHLPQAKHATAAENEPTMVTIPASFRRDGVVRLNKSTVKIEFLAERVRQEMSGRLNQSVILAGDATVTLQELMTVMDRLKDGGIEKVLIQTQPPTPGGAP